MRHKDDDAPAWQGEGCHEDDFAAHSVPQDRPPVARPGLLWVVTPAGTFWLDTGRVFLPFLRVVVPGWLALGDVWDAIPRAFQRQLEADGIGRRAVEEPLLLAYFAALTAATR